MKTLKWLEKARSMFQEICIDKDSWPGTKSSIWQVGSHKIKGLSIKETVNPGRKNASEWIWCSLTGLAFKIYKELKKLNKKHKKTIQLKT